MGSSCLISCSECFYMKELKIGIGMMYSPELLMDLDSEFALLPDLISSKEILADIRMLLEEKDAEIADGYGHQVYRCPECNDFFDQFYLRLEYESGSYEVKYICPECGVSLERLALDVVEKKPVALEKYPCPKCGNYSLQCSEGPILWD